MKRARTPDPTLEYARGRAYLYHDQQGAELPTWVFRHPRTGQVLHFVVSPEDARDALPEPLDCEGGEWVQVSDRLWVSSRPIGGADDYPWWQVMEATHTDYADWWSLEDVARREGSP